MSECRWKRPTWRHPADGVLYHLVPMPSDPKELGVDADSPCGGAECKDRRKRMAPKLDTGKVWRPADGPHGANRTWQDERRAPGQITDRRDKEKGERRRRIERLAMIHGRNVWKWNDVESEPWKDDPRSGQDRRRSQSAPVQTGGGHPEEHQRQAAEGIVRGEIVIHALRSNCAILCKCGGKGLTACDRQAAATHIEQQAAEIQRLQAALTYAETANANTAGIVADLNREVARLREALEDVTDYACPGSDYTWKAIMKTPWLAPHRHMIYTAEKVKAALTPKEPNGDVTGK